jgi:hypothetical protein
MMDEMLLHNPVYMVRVLHEHEAASLQLSLRHKYMADAEEMEYWAAYFGDTNTVIEPETNEPF